MSIAASVVVRPSRHLLTLVATLCLGVVAIGGVLALGALAELAFWTRLLCASACLLLAGGGFAATRRGRSAYRLDISGSGQIRLSLCVPKAARATDIAASEPNEGGMLVTLLADSTLWPHFMLLRLQDQSGRLHALPILPDSVSAESFRALSVACRWIAAHRVSEANEFLH
jgi:hypothetical protein